MKPLCIHHHPCADGFTAAWVVHNFFDKGGVDFHPGVYGEPPPDVTGRHVIMVDFTYKKPVLEEMAKSAASITILDHHKSAQEDLAGFATIPCSVRAWDRTVRGVRCFFDMERSGAQLAWDFFYSGPRPPLVDYVADRDLWKFKLPFSRAIGTAIFAYEYDFDIWSMLHDKMTIGLDDIENEGIAILRKQDKDIKELLQQTRRTMVIGGYVVPVANLPYTLASEAAGKMAEENGVTFAACYFDRGDGQRQFSLRSRGDFDVSKIAGLYGGGGHKNASGFQRPLGWEGDQ